MRIKHALLLICFILFCPQISQAWAGYAEGLKGRLIVGYQGWFGCPGDYGGNKYWQRWFRDGAPVPGGGSIPDAAHLAVDFLPSVDGFSKKDLCKTGMRLPNGAPVYLFSSQNANVVDTHFKWMASHGIDGAALQRFIAPVVMFPDYKKRSDHMIMNAMLAAQKSRRVFYVVYDVSGARPFKPERLVGDIETDWKHLVNDLKITASPSYLHVNGKPVLELWGFGFTGAHPNSPAVAETIIQDLKKGRNGLQAAYLIGGVPASWRTLNADSRRSPAWAKVYRSFDVISPWSVGRYLDEAGANAFLNLRVLPDLAVTRKLGIGYMPVIFPGFSWSNEQRFENPKLHTVLNQSPRLCGNLMWRQVSNLLGAGVNMVYAAMFDEVDEGTALMPVAARMDELPAGAHMDYLDQDGCNLPDDWYLQVAGKAAGFLKSGQKPPADLGSVLKP